MGCYAFQIVGEYCKGDRSIEESTVECIIPH
jgi:hypothetical protein